MTDTITIYHNPRCSKSRDSLALLREKGFTPNVVLYLDAPPEAKTLQRLLDALGMRAIDLLRKKEAAYKTINPNREALTEVAALNAMIRYPQLIERPIVVRGDRAVIGRPPENVLELLHE